MILYVYKNYIVLIKNLFIIFKKMYKVFFTQIQIADGREQGF